MMVAKHATLFSIVTSLISVTVAEFQVKVPPKVQVELFNPVNISCTWTHTLYPNEKPVAMWHVNKGGNHEAIYYFQNQSYWVGDDLPEYIGRIGHIDKFTLVIFNVSVIDNRYFFCQVMIGREGSDEQEVKLDVFKAPTFESDLDDSLIKVGEELLVGRCVARKGYPAPRITWYNGTNVVQQSPDVNISTEESSDSDGLITTTSSLRIIASIPDDGAKIKCSMQYDWFNQKVITNESKLISISVFYPMQQIKIKVPSKKPVLEGTNVTMLCETNGKPPANYTWYLNNELLKDEVPDSPLSLTSVTSKNSGNYSCQANQSVWNTFMTVYYELTVHYIVEPVLSGKPVETVNVSNPFNISCSANSSMPPSYSWQKNGDFSIIKSQTLSFESVAPKDSGVYTCTASLSEVPQANESKSFQLEVLSKPEMVKSQIITGYEDTTVELYCRSFGCPKPSSKWEGVDGSNQDIKWYAKNCTYTSVISIVIESEEQLVNCTASNRLGQSKTNFRLKKKNTPGNGGVLAGIITAVLLIALVCSALYWAFKNKQLCFAQKAEFQLNDSKEVMATETERFDIEDPTRENV
uniref:Ig-like domain-containing protein n=1 Tax=Eptatretus burgeri TaxID=7764 RepID=A0A8C4QUM2_EPTBU